MIIRTEHHKQYVTITNSALEDERLSYRARGVLASILAKPDNWIVSTGYLAAKGREGTAAVQAALKELEAMGYYEGRRERAGDGTFIWRTTVREVPLAGNPRVAVRREAKPKTGDREVTSTQGESTDGVNKNREVTEEDVISKNEPRASSEVMQWIEGTESDEPSLNAYTMKLSKEDITEFLFGLRASSSLGELVFEMSEYPRAWGARNVKGERMILRLKDLLKAFGVPQGSITQVVERVRESEDPLAELTHLLGTHGRALP